MDFMDILFYLNRSVPEQSQADSELLIKTRLGKIKGTYINKYVVAWLGIPYAEPPLGKRKNHLTFILLFVRIKFNYVKMYLKFYLLKENCVLDLLKKKNTGMKM